MNDLPLLGITFLSAAYLFVDNERSEFTLWQANPTTEQDLVAVAPLDACTAPSASSTSTVTVVTASASSGSSKNTSIGAIAGGVVGGVAILTLLIGTTTWLCCYAHKKRYQRSISSSNNLLNQTEPGMATAMYSNPVTAELPGITDHQKVVIAGYYELDNLPS